MSAGWPSSPLSDVCTVTAGQSPKAVFYNEDGQGLPFYQGKKEFTERLIGQPTKWTTFVTKEAEAGDILMSVRAPVGPINQATERICIGRGLAAIRSHGTLSQDYLWYVLLWLQPTIRGNAGAVFESINKEGIERLRIPVPLPEEQRRIVAILDEAFEGLDRARAYMKANLEDASELLVSFRGGLFDPKMNDLVARRIGEVVRLQRGFDLPKKNRESGPYSIISASGPIDTHSEAKVAGPGVVTGRSGTIGRVFFVENDFWPLNTTLYVKDFQGNDVRFVFHMLAEIGLQKFAGGTGVPTLNRNDVHVKSVHLPIQSDAQREVAEAIDAVAEHVKGLLVIYRSRTQLIDDLRQSLLQRAFAGELR